MSESQFKAVQIAMNVAGMAFLAAAGLLGCAWEVTKPAVGMILFGALLIAAPQIVLRMGSLRRDKIRHRDEALAALTDLCFNFLDVPEVADPRVTLLLVDNGYRRPMLRAVTRSCAKENTVPTSTMEITQGVAGRCYRQKCVIVQEDVVDFMTTMKDLGFEEEDAKEFKLDRKNYVCIPVMADANNVLAILCLDAKEANVYDASRVELAERFTPFFARLLTMETTVEG